MYILDRPQYALFWPIDSEAKVILADSQVQTLVSSLQIDFSTKRVIANFITNIKCYSLIEMLRKTATYGLATHPEAITTKLRPNFTVVADNDKF